MNRTLLGTALAGVLSLGLFTGCPDREVSKVDPNQDKAEVKRIPVQLNRNVDILFVIDDSGSMADEQSRLGSNFPNFINVLASIQGGLPDIHLGVVSSNVGAGSFTTSGCGTSDNGNLQVQTACTSMLTGNFISDISNGTGGRNTNYTGNLSNVFTCLATLGTGGCGFEQHLESMRRALSPSNSNNANFLRPEAFLAIVILADEDDCSTENLALFDNNSALGPLGSFRCFEYGVECDQSGRGFGPRTNCRAADNSQYMYEVEQYIQFLKDLKEDDLQIIVAGIFGNTEPVNVGPDSDMPNNPDLEVSCSAGGSGGARPGIRLQAFLDGFPNRNTYTTICNDDLSDAMTLIGNLLKESIGDPCIEGDLADIDPNTPNIQPDCQVSDIRFPGTDMQVEDVVRQCTTSPPTGGEQLPCWYLELNRTQCPATDMNGNPQYPTGLMIKVERGGASVPSQTYLDVQCVVN